MAGRADASDRQLHVVVSGRVQGVGFRWFVRESARRLDLAGWVRNLSDGAVEVAASGEAGQLEQLRRALERGPDRAKVAAVVDLAALDEVLPERFEIRG